MSIEAYDFVPIDERRLGAGIYAYHDPTSNALELGLRYESQSGLQLRHVKGMMIHERDVDNVISQIDKGHQIMLPAGPLKDLFEGFEFLDLTEYGPQVAELLVNVAETAFGGVFGDLRTGYLSLGEDSFVWLLYDREDLRLKIGLGCYKPDGSRILGETTYSLPRRAVEQFAAELFTSSSMLWLKPPVSTDIEPPYPLLDPDTQALLAIEIIRLYDATAQH